MAKVKEDLSRVRLEVDGKQAINQLGKLEMETKQLAIDLKMAKKGTQEYVDANKRLKESEARLKSLRKEIGLNGMTMSQLSRYQRQLRRDIQNTTTKGTAEYKKLKSELLEVNRVLIHQRKEIAQTGNGFTGMLGKISKTAGALGVILGAGALIQGFRALIGASSEFQQSISDLSSITGATGEQLQELEDAARRIGSVTTLSAQQTADAFTIIASKKPELLENNAALIATTEAAITLAEAAGIDLPQAADALTNSLNQFNLGAEESQRIINVLAAGSKFGAGNIEFLNDAVKRFGPVAQSMNISFEESVAMMEVFAEKGIESEKAGVQFRNILVRLASGADETNPAIVGMSTAIENLGKQQLTTAELAKQFGTENLVAAQVLINSSQRFQEFTDKVTGTDVALEQARVRVDNFKGDMKSLMSITADYAIVIGGLITEGLRPFVKALTAALIALKETPKFLKENKDILIALGIALVTFNTAQIAATALMLKDIAIKKAHAIWTGAVTTAQTLLNAAMTANPIGLVIKAIGLLTGAFVILYNRSETVRAGIAGIAEVGLTVWEIIKETFGAITDGFKKIFDGDFAGGMKQLGMAFIKSNPVGLALTEGKRLAGAFAKGYKDKLAEEQGGIQEANIDLINPNLGQIDTGNLTEENSNEYTGQVGKIMRTMQVAISAPDSDVFKETEAGFAKLKEVHEKFGLDINSIQEATNASRMAKIEEFNKKQLDEEEKLAQAKLDLAQSLSMGLGALIDLIGNKQSELTGFQKALAVAQIAIDTAAALGKVLPLALNTSAKDGPLAAFTLAGYIASMTASVLSGAARAKNLLGSANVPEWDGGGGAPDASPRRRGAPTTQQSFYWGGYTGDQGLGMGDQYGDFAGAVHTREYVIPSVTMSDPYVANLLPAIEQVRQDNIRGFSSMGKGMSTDALEKKMDQLIAVASQWPKEIKGKWVYSDLEDLEIEDQLLKSRYRA